MLGKCRRRGVVFVISVSVAVSGVAVAWASGGQGPESKRLQISTDKPPRPDPDAGMTHEQVEAAQEAHWNDFQSRFAAWETSDPVVNNPNWKTVPRMPRNGSSQPGYGSFEEATDHADLVILGHVINVRASGFDTETTFAVERSAKGTSAPVTITIVQAGGLRPDNNYDQPAYLAFSEASPFLFAGDRAILLVSRSPVREGAYYIQAFSGEYPSTGGRVHSVKGNKFNDVDNSTEGDLMDRADRHVRNSAPTSTP